MFIFKTCSDQILAKLNQSWGLLLLFSHQEVPKFTEWKNFLHLEVAEIDMGGGQFWVKEYDSGHKTIFLKAKPISGRGEREIAEFDDLFPFSEGNFVTFVLKN